MSAKSKKPSVRAKIISHCSWRNGTVLAVPEQTPDHAESIRLLNAENARLKAELELERREKALLAQKIDLLIRKIFGVKSEKLDPAQLELLLTQVAAGKDGASAEPEAAPIIKLLETRPTKKRLGERRERWPEDLPVVREVIEPEVVKANPEQYRCIGEEVSEQLDFDPARFYRRQIIRRKFVSRQDTDLPPVMAPLPESLQERCIAAPGLLAHIIVSKYCDHLPLYRQEQIYFERHGVWLPRQSQARWAGLASEWLYPIYEAIKAGVMAGGYIQVDETPVRYLDPGNGKTGGDVVFDWHASRAATCLDNLIPVDFNGVLQCDGYMAYDSFANRRARLEKPLTLAGCWAHVRRGFFEAKDLAPAKAGWVLLQIQHLYSIERKLRAIHAGPQLRDAHRASESRMIVTRIHRALTMWRQSGRILPQSSLGKAISYALNQWASLEIYLTNGGVEIDNNLVENAIRPTAVGKKNWLFFGAAEAGERSAVLYTIIESCRRRGVEPYAYLRDVLTRLPKMTNWQIKDITPEAWAKAQKASLPKAA
jgi:transposase